MFKPSRTISLQNGRVFSDSAESFEEDDRYIIYRSGWFTKERINRDHVVRDTEHFNPFLSLGVVSLLTLIAFFAIVIIVSGEITAQESTVNPSPPVASLTSFPDEDNVDDAELPACPYPLLLQQLSTLPLLAINAQGEVVEVFQTFLNQQLNAHERILIDGHYGNQTENAVIVFQGRNQLTVDGMVGTDTWAKVQSMINC